MADPQPKEPERVTAFLTSDGELWLDMREAYRREEEIAYEKVVERFCSQPLFDPGDDREVWEDDPPWI